MSKLLIIEAPGKIQTLKKAAEQVFPGISIQVLATGGLLKELSKNELGFDVHSFELKNELILENGIQFDAILQKNVQDKNKWDEIFVVSDPDREGEGIAKQIWDFLAKYDLDKIAKRLLVNDLTPNGLKNSILESEPRLGKLKARTARRIIDRIIPKALSYLTKSSHWQGKGRIQIPACKIILQKEDEWNHYHISGSPWSKLKNFKVDLHVKDADQAAKIHIALENFNPTNKEASIHEVVVPPPPPHTAASILQIFRNSFPEHVAEAAQEAYMLGRISYPRSDDTKLFAHQKRLVSSFASRMHMSNNLRDGWWEDDEGGGTASSNMFVQGAHPGLHPVDGIFEAPPPTYSHLAQEVELEIAARAIASLMKPAILKVSSFVIHVPGVCDVPIQKKELIESGWTIAYERMGKENPLIPQSWERKLSIKETNPTRSDIASWLYEAGLGRPSTLAYIPSRMIENGLVSSYCVVTEDGKNLLKDAERKLPKITQKEFTQSMENNLSKIENDPDLYIEIMQKIILSSGFDILLLKELEKPIIGFNSPSYVGTSQKK